MKKTKVKAKAKTFYVAVTRKVREVFEVTATSKEEAINKVVDEEYDVELIDEFTVGEEDIRVIKRS